MTATSVYKDLILIPNPNTDNVPVHNNRVKLEKRGFVVYEFPFEKHWNYSIFEENILNAFKDKDLMDFEYVKVNANLSLFVDFSDRDNTTRAGLP